MNMPLSLICWKRRCRIVAFEIMWHVIVRSRIKLNISIHEMLSWNDYGKFSGY